MKNLIIGGSSNLGSCLINSSKKDYFDFTYFKKKKINGIQFDILKGNKKELNIQNYNSVILLSSISNPEICQKEKNYSKLINIDATVDLIKYISEKKKKLIFFSSEYVYDGRKGNYSELDKPNPINLYGHQKFTVEEFIKRNIEDYTILRVAKTYGDNFNHSSFFSFFYSELIKKKKKRISIIEDEFFSPLHTSDLAWIVKYSIKNKINLINVGGPEKLSRLDCVKKFFAYNKLNNISINLIKRKTSLNEVLIPKDVSFNVGKIYTLKKKLVNFDFFLKKIYDHKKY